MYTKIELATEWYGIVRTSPNEQNKTKQQQKQITILYRIILLSMATKHWNGPSETDVPSGWIGQTDLLFINSFGILTFVRSKAKESTPNFKLFSRNFFYFVCVLLLWLLEYNFINLIFLAIFIGEWTCMAFQHNVRRLNRCQNLIDFHWPKFNRLAGGFSHFLFFSRLLVRLFVIQ